MKALSLFANIGMAETYLSELGIDVVVANEILEDRAKLYRHFYPTCDVVQGDITDKKIFNKIIKKCKQFNIDIVIATPPCQGMSIAGDMNPYDERNSLVKYAVDAINILKPKYVFLENVRQQLTTPISYCNKEMTIPEYLISRLGSNYKINMGKIINSADYGVPQIRKRAIILMSRNDCSYWKFPNKSRKEITLEKAFKGIPDLFPLIKEKEYRGKLPENSPEALSFHKYHKPPRHVWRNVECMLFTPTGNTAFDNEYYYPKRKDGKKIKGYDTTYHRMFWSKPAPTVTMYNGIMGSQNNVHPGKAWKRAENGLMMYTNPRVLTIYELLIVSTLPLNWDIPEWCPDILLRHAIGEGIPPLLVKKIFSKLLEMEENR